MIIPCPAFVGDCGREGHLKSASARELAAEGLGAGAEERRAQKAAAQAVERRPF